MRHMHLVAAVAVVALGACGDNLSRAVVDAKDAPPAPCTPVRGETLSVRKVGDVPGIAVLATSPPGDRRLFVVVREGTIRIFDHEVLLEQPFIDLSPHIFTEVTVELGMLGLAFHPRYASNGQFFVFYTTRTHSTVARCSVSATSADRAEPGCVPILEALHDTGHNHNGGMIEFGPDGYLYIGTGDGGGAGDPSKRAQDPTDLLGKILRIDVDTRGSGQQYGIPADNPYASGGGRPEIFISGLRNPWRWSFDRATGDLWIGDVGQGRYEEMTVLRPAQQAGANLGWSIFEGPGCCATQDDRCLQEVGAAIPCDPDGLTFPQDARDRSTLRGDGWASIVAGETYRGTCFPDLVGYHFYADVYVDVLVKARLLADDTLELTDVRDVIGTQTSSIHADGRGELFLTKTGGAIYQLVAGP